MSWYDRAYRDGRPRSRSRNRRELETPKCGICLDTIASDAPTWNCAGCSFRAHDQCLSATDRGGRGCPVCRATQYSLSDRLAIPRRVTVSGAICYRCRCDLPIGVLAHRCALPTSMCIAYWCTARDCQSTTVPQRGCPACGTRMAEAIRSRAIGHE